MVIAAAIVLQGSEHAGPMVIRISGAAGASILPAGNALHGR